LKRNALSISKLLFLDRKYLVLSYFSSGLQDTSVLTITQSILVQILEDVKAYFFQWELVSIKGLLFFVN